MLDLADFQAVTELRCSSVPDWSAYDAMAATSCSARGVTSSLPSVAHQENKGPDVFPWSPIHVLHQDRIDHQTRLSFPEQEILDGLRHQVSPREPDEDRYGID